MNDRISLIESITQHQKSSDEVHVQMNMVRTITERLGLDLALDEIRNNVKTMRKHEATLFRLKQIEMLLSTEINVHEQRNLRDERSIILDEVKMPVGIPMAQFAAESPENASIMAQFIEDLKSGKLVLS